jgi:hypothetical protein
MSPRKRRRSQAFPETDNVVGSPVDADEHPDFTDRSEKEREVWDAFREEHFESKYLVFGSSSKILPI